ncbi:MAG TPA: hypothetical protein VG871_05830 [Vicinamibacterales bacterium]|nr:hypothetical protein [Vicinamibacterales bacterium]
MLLLALAMLALSARADAHRLDEYLQAAKISVAADRVGLELDLSPGVAVADGIVRGIDADGDDYISEAEADDYAAGVLRALTLSVDGRSLPLRLERRAVPSVDAMRQGVGVIRLEASAAVPAGAGRRELAFANGFLPATSVYLVNALVPSDPRVTLVSQQRDPLQRTYSLEYEIAGGRAWAGWLATALGLFGLLILGRRRRPARV